MPLMAFFIAVHTSIVLFQCHVAQRLASWAHGPLPPPQKKKKKTALGKQQSRTFVHESLLTAYLVTFADVRRRGALWPNAARGEWVDF